MLLFVVRGMPSCLSYVSGGIRCPWCTCDARGCLPGSGGTELVRQDRCPPGRDIAESRQGHEQTTAFGSKSLRRCQAGKGANSMMGALSWGWSGAAPQTGWCLSRDLRKWPWPLVKEECVARRGSMCKGPVAQCAWCM